MEDMDEIVQEFLVESHENLDQLDRDLVALEQEPASTETLSRIFRTIHTIKGTSGFLAFAELEAVTHVGESLLSRLRDGVLELSPEMAGALLDMVDAVRSILAEIERTGAEGHHDNSALLAVLTALQEPGAEDGRPPLIGEVLTARGVVGPEEVSLALTSQDLGDDRRLGEILVDDGDATPSAVEAALVEQADERRSVADSTIRVDVDLLDRLMNLVGELVLTRNQIVQGAAARQDVDLLRSSHRLDVIASELQEGVMRTRMQTIGTVWSKLPRVVRDLTHQLDKQVRVQMEGLDTELDRTILEAVKDPLTHLVRNAVGHGIEHPQDRTAAGKPAEGTLTLRAFHEGGQVTIEISDDGAGIDPRRIRERAVTSGIIPPEAAAGLSDRDALALIFAPGFSTASEITNVSGRGVGMDVVKTNVEKIGGAVDVQSTLGRGTTIRVRIPLTLAIIQALLVVVAGKRFAIPQVNLLELFRLEGDVDAQGLEWVHGAPVFRLRGQLLPLVSLRWQLELGDDELQTSYVAVLQADEQRFGLVVDRIEDTEEIVVKPLGAALRQVPVYAGATILGDGQIALILDTMALAHRAGVGNIAVPSEPKPPAEPLHDDRAHLLLVALSDGRCVGVPLEAVERLEEFESARIEQVGGHEVLQYRDRILPLVRLEAPDAATDQDEDAVEHVVVCRHQGTLIGLVIHQVLDIVDTELSVRSPLAGEGELGSAVVGGRVTELLDVAHAVSGLDPAVFARTELSVV